MVRLYKIFINTLFVLLIAVLGIYVFFRFTNKVEIFSVKTGSMEDNIHVGDYVLIYRKNNYNVGDIVTYKKNNYFITHRIIRNDNNQIVTKGDANNTEDETIDISDIVGKVIISGGILNIIVNYKFAIAAIFVALYLISCYFGDTKEDNIDNQEIFNDEINQNNDEITDNSNTDNIESEYKEKDIEQQEENVGKTEISTEDTVNETKEENETMIEEKNNENKIEETLIKKKRKNKK